MTSNNFKKIAIFGATGAQGSAVVREALNQNINVRAVARQTDKIIKQFGPTVEPCAADFLNQGSLVEALSGMDSVFVHLPIPTDPNHPQQFLENILTAAHKVSLPLLVFTTGGPSGKRYDQIPMIAGLTAATQAVLQSGVPSIVLHPTIYLENLLVPPFVPTLWTEHKLSYPPIRSAQKMGYISHSDQAKFACAALQKPDLAGKSYEILSKYPLAGDELAKAVSTWVGGDVAFTPLPPEEFGTHISEILQNSEMGEGLAALYTVLRNLEDDSFSDINIDVLEELFGITLTPISDQIAQWPKLEV